MLKVTVESSTLARATSDVILITADTAAAVAAAPILTRFDGNFTDVLHRVGNEWLFASRRGTINSKCVL
jgi:hypothetical protein